MNLKLCCLCVFTGMLPVLGADAHEFRLGLGTFISNPAGSLRGSFSPSEGFGGSAFVTESLGKGFGYIWDISFYSTFSDKAIATPGGANVKATFTSTGTSVAFTYHLKERSIGPYLMAGLGSMRYEGVAKLPNGTPQLLPKQNFGGNALTNYYTCDTGNKLAVVVGLGYDFNDRWGLMVRYKSIQSMGHTLAAVESGISMHF